MDSVREGLRRHGERDLQRQRPCRTPIGTRVLLLLIQTLRFITVYAPRSMTRWKITALIDACVRRLPAGQQMVIRARDGRRFRINPHEPQYAMGLLDGGVFEPDETDAAARCTAPGAVVVDAGSNFGWYTTLFSRLVGVRGSVHAFEPLPPAVAILQENCHLNGCDNVQINACALGDRASEATLYYHPGRACGDASLFPAADQAAQAYRCPMVTLDDYFARHRLDRCDFIKCDVEGAEFMVLRGAAGVLERFKPTVLIEINPATLQRAGCRGRDVLEELRRHSDYAFEVVSHPGYGRHFIEPGDCDAFATYVNILCHPVRPALGRAS